MWSVAVFITRDGRIVHCAVLCENLVVVVVVVQINWSLYLLFLAILCQSFTALYCYEIIDVFVIVVIVKTTCLFA